MTDRPTQPSTDAPPDARVLRARTHDALAELRSLRCADPAAADALHAVRLTERTLTDWVAPTLDAIVARKPRRSGG